MTRLHKNRLSLSKLRNCYLQTDSLKVWTSRYRCGNGKKKTRYIFFNRLQYTYQFP